jgi:hypothetical protein
MRSRRVVTESLLFQSKPEFVPDASFMGNCQELTDGRRASFVIVPDLFFPLSTPPQKRSYMTGLRYIFLDISNFLTPSTVVTPLSNKSGLTFMSPCFLFKSISKTLFTSAKGESFLNYTFLQFDTNCERSLVALSCTYGPNSLAILRALP